MIIFNIIITTHYLVIVQFLAIHNLIFFSQQPTKMYKAYIFIILMV